MSASVTVVCYDEAGELICGLEEHTHDESCFIEPVVYYCGLEEHTHSETCYDESGALICGLEEHTHTDACLEQIIIQTADIDDHSLRVTAAYGPEANIPEGAVLKVEVIPPQGETQEQYSEYVEEARELFTSDPDHMQNMEPLALLNIGFFLADGTEVQPAAPVTMTIQFLGETGEFGDEIKVVHFADTGTEVLDSSEISAEQTTTFTAEGFSIYLPVSLTDFPEAYSISNGGGSGDHSTTQLEHHKTIDYLGDNNKKADKNPDTSLDNGSVDELKDKYRLYLDIVGKSEPANLLVVVDRSNSMTHKFGDYSSRGEAVYDLLFDGKDSMVYKFLERNEHATNGEKTSYVAVTWFGGWYPGYDKEDHYLGSKKLNAYGQYVYDDAYTSSIGYTKSRRYAGGKKPDAGLSLKWTSNKNAASKMGYDKIRPLSQNTKLDEPMEGTNYCAGLMYASYMLHNMPGNAADETIVIFISDGVPTYFYLPGSFDANTETKKVVRYGEAIEEKALSCADGLLGGTYKGQYGFFSNTKGFFDEFIKANSNVKFFTLGIALKSGGDRMSVLNYMSKLGNGKEETDNVTDYSSLKKALQEIIFPADVTITDTLSANVTLLTAQPDVKVTATPRDSAGKPNGDPIVLWKSTGSVTFSGDKITIGERKDRDVGTEKKIVSGVYYDGKKIWVDFRDDYTLDPNYTYTLSFNVELTEQAFDTYATNGYPTNGYPDTGENPSDYGSNKTSSGQSGLFSNVDKDTTVKYKIDYKDGSMDYEMPVVQAWKSEFTLVKQDSTLGADGSTVHNKLANVPFCLQRSYEGGVQYIGPTGAALYSGTVPTLPSEIKGATFYLTDGNGMLAYGGLAHGTYKLYELVPDAYEGGGTVKLVASFTVSRGRITYTDAHDTNLTWKADPHTDKVNTSYTDKLTLTVTNPVAHHEIQLIKVDGSTKANLAGAEFELRKQIKTASGESWNIVTTYKSVDNGVFFKGELYSGFYRLTEERAPDNYQLLEETVYFVVDGVKPYLHLADSTGVKINATANQYAEITQDGGLALKVYDKIKTFNFALRKVDMSGTGLAGAEFALYKAEDVTKGSDGTMTVIEGSTPIWQDVSGGDGKFAKPLPNDVKAGDTYYLFETVTPAGYNSLSGPIEIKVQNNGVTAMLGEKQLKFEKDVTQTPVLYTILIENSTGFVLPRSGGEGTTVYLLSGAALIALAGSLLLLKRKKEHEA